MKPSQRIHRGLDWIEGVVEPFLLFGLMLLVIGSILFVVADLALDIM